MSSPYAFVRHLAVLFVFVLAVLLPAVSAARSFATSTAVAKATAKGVDKANGDAPFLICSKATGPFRPFCEPTNGTEVFVGETYYVTWDSDYYSNAESTVIIEMVYTEASSGGSAAYTSEKTENSFGYVPIKMDKKWLQGHKRNALTFYIVHNDAKESSRARVIKGPTVILTNKPKEKKKFVPSSQRDQHNRAGVLIGIPLVFGLALFIVLGLHFGMRNTRKIGLGNVMGHHPEWQEERQRHKFRSKNKGVRFEEVEAGNPMYKHD